MLTGIKDIVIQAAFIIAAICFTVLIASSSMRSQYTEFYESTLEEKAGVIARGAASVLAEMRDVSDTASAQAVLDLLFSQGAGPENIYFALYDTVSGRRIAANTPEALSGIPAIWWEDDYSGDPLVLTHSFVDEQERFAVAVGIDYSPFLIFRNDLESALYSAMLRGSGLMAASFAVFTYLSKRRKQKKEIAPIEEPDGNFHKLLTTQIIAIFVLILLSLPFVYLYFQQWSIIRAGAMIVGGFFLLMAAVHIIRLMKWFFLWYFKRPISSYSAQTLQFVVFLIVFLAQFSIAVQNGYQTQLELSRQDELRLSSMFTALTYYARDQQPDQPASDGDREYFIILRTDGEFHSAGLERMEISQSYDLLETAWDSGASVSGVRGGYMYGVSAVADSEDEPTALICVRQPHILLVDELAARNIDFLLGMTATVLALVFLFVELNKLLEAINTPLVNRERALRYALGGRGLVFLVTMSQFIPQYFFVLIVFDIYQHSPVGWLPGDMAVTLPLFLTLPIMLFGKSIVGRFLRLDRRAAITLGCAAGAAGFLLMGIAGNFYVFLLTLVFTYTGVSMVYNGLWDYVVYASGFDYPELRSIKEYTVGGEFLGYTSGAVIGAMVYDKFGLMAAMSLSAAILLLLGVLIRFTLSAAGGLDEDAARRPAGDSYTFLSFLGSKNIIRYAVFLVLPFVVAPSFVSHFSPLYAESVSLSPGAVSWTSLIQVIFVAYISPKIAGVLSRRLSHTAVAVSANILSAGALFLFALRPGLTALYAASAMIGCAAGIGSATMATGYYRLPEAQSYSKSRFVYFLFRSVGGQAGIILFTVAHASSAGGEFILAIALPIAALSLAYAFMSKEAKS